VRYGEEGGRDADENRCFPAFPLLIPLVQPFTRGARPGPGAEKIRERFFKKITGKIFRALPDF